MPENIFDLIPYQNTLDALEDQSDNWEENLHKNLCNYVCMLANKIYQWNWSNLETKEEKRQVVK